MSKYEISRMTGGVIVALIGVAVALGGFQLRNGAPPSWPDVIAADTTVKSAAKGMVAVGVLLFTAGAAATLGIGWGYAAATSATAAFVLGAFWANYVLFGDIRLIHTGPNVLVGMLVVWLLWVGYSLSKSSGASL